MSARSIHSGSAARHALAALIAILPVALPAQQSLGVRTTSVGPVVEHWSFGSGLWQHTGADSVLLRGATQLSLPVAVFVPLGDRLTLDVSGSWTSGSVALRGRDVRLGPDRYRLSGATDVRVRALGRVVGDNVVVTVGVNAPTGRTSLDEEELAALRVLAAPALRLQSPAIGRGPGGTAGLVLARQIAGWAWALGGSYDLTGTYSPIASIVAGAPSSDMDPGDVLHVSLGVDGLIGQSGMTLALSTDRYGADRFSSGGGDGFRVQLGPTYTAEWQLRLAAPGLRELTVSAADRYRTAFEQNGRRVAGSSGNQFDAAVRAVVPASPAVGLVLGVDGRHQTGLSVDNALATAAVRAGGLLLGLEIGAGRLLVQPFARVQAATIDNGAVWSSGTGTSAGITVGTRF